MSECTKGKMSLSANGLWVMTQNKKGSWFNVTKMAFEKWMDDEKDYPINYEIAKANAKEFVRRWNGYENGGLVEELRTTIDEEYVLRLKIEKQRDKMEKALEDCAFLADTAIASTPTGDLRNKLTEINILRLATLAKS